MTEWTSSSSSIAMATICLLLFFSPFLRQQAFRTFINNLADPFSCSFVVLFFVYSDSQRSYSHALKLFYLAFHGCDKRSDQRFFAMRWLTLETVERSSYFQILLEEWRWDLFPETRFQDNLLIPFVKYPHLGDRQALAVQLFNRAWLDGGWPSHAGTSYCISCLR